MKTIVLDRPEHFTRLETSEPGPLLPGQALLRVRSIGVCGTDLHGYMGRQPFFEYPRIIGHELGADVVSIAADVTNVSVGDRCSVRPYLTCGICIACRRGKSNCCTTLKCLGVHTDGGMRDFIALPANNLHVANDLTYDQLALVETLCIGGHAVDRAVVQPDEHVLVIGAGPIGLGVIEFLRQVTPNIIVMDVSISRLGFCAEHLGIQRTVVAGENALRQVESMTNGELPTAVFDATGNPGSMMSAFQYVSHGGRLVYVGLCQADITFSDPFLHRREITLLASRNAVAANFDKTIRLIKSGRIDTRPWITHNATFDTVVENFPTWLRPDSGTIKAMVHWS